MSMSSVDDVDGGDGDGYLIDTGRYRKKVW